VTYYHEHQAEFLEGLKTFPRIPSISTLSEHKPDIRRAAEFALSELRAAGMTAAELIEGEGNRLDEWQSPPFEPELRGEDIFARRWRRQGAGLYSRRSKGC